MGADQGEPRRYWLGFDLGGSKMLAVVFDQAFKPIVRARKKTRAQAGPRQGLERIAELIGEALSAAGITAADLGGIGVGCPGPLDLDEGIVVEMPNLGWRNTKLKAFLEKSFGCGVVVINDVDAGVYGEYRFGAARGARCCVGVFIGTGIGGGAVYKGEMLRGERRSCVEIGHLPVMPDGPLCGCGRRGCLEAVAGRLAISAAAASAAYRGEAPHLLQATGTDISEIRSRALASAIAAGDRAIENIVREAARTVGWAMAGVVNLLAPDVVVLGGGMVEDMPVLWQEEVSRTLKARVMPTFEKAFRVEVAELSGDASVTGAAAWAAETLAGRHR
jgi:glucokinase